MTLQIAGYIILLTIWTWVRVLSFLKKRKKTEAVLYGGLMAVAAVIGSLLISGANISRLNAPIEFIFQPIGQKVLK